MNIKKKTDNLIQFQNSSPEKLPLLKIIKKENIKAMAELKNIKEIKEEASRCPLKQVQKSYRLLSESVFKMIQTLKIIAPDEYLGLLNRYSKITNEAEKKFSSLNNKKNTPHFLQTGPLDVISPGKQIPKMILPSPKIKGGIKASPGCVSGKVFKAQKKTDLLSFPKNFIMLISKDLTVWLPHLDKARGLVSEEGDFSCTIANHARKLKIPAIMNLKGAMNLLVRDETITLDANNLVIYAGEIKEILSTKQKTNADFSKYNEDLKKKNSKQIFSLILGDSQHSVFSEQKLISLYDIVKFIQKTYLKKIKQPENST